MFRLQRGFEPGPAAIVIDNIYLRSFILSILLAKKGERMKFVTHLWAKEIHIILTRHPTSHLTCVSFGEKKNAVISRVIWRKQLSKVNTSSFLIKKERSICNIFNKMFNNFKSSSRFYPRYSHNATYRWNLHN